MLLIFALFVSLWGCAVCRPPVVTPYGNFSTDPISQEDRDWLSRHLVQHRSSFPSGFHFMYVAQDGHIAPDTRPAGNYIKIVGSPRTSKNTLYVAALELYKMLKLAPAHIVSNIISHDSGLGIFTAQETVTVFPDFAHLADTPACRGRCDGQCSRTCTTDGRKYSSLAGITGTMALVIEDNVLCTASDSYHHRDNVLVHEFAHVIDGRGMSTNEKTQKTNAFNNARAQSIWRAGTYAMSNSAEYFAEATGAFFLVNLQTQCMTDCSYGECRTESDARYLLQSRDPQLFSLLSHVYTSDRPSVSSGIKVCYSTTGR